jgi:Nucleotidyl transferase AbiEii toxin, Type IV TA system
VSDASPQVLASRQLLQEVCALLAPFRDDAVLIGGWVPDIRFPQAYPGHVGSIDVDFAMRSSKARHAEVVALLTASGFRTGAEPYQFVKNLDVGGRSFPVRLDLLTSPEHHAATFAGATAAPFPASGTDFAFSDNTVESVGSAEIRVASIVPLIVMKAYAILERTKPKDAYDLNFCLENFPGGIPALAVEFSPVIGDVAVQDVLTRLAGRFRDEEDSGPCDVVEVEQPMGEARAIRKFAVFTNVDDFLRAVGIRR